MMNGIKISGEKLRKIRKSKTYSQGEIAKAVGSERETVSGWEKPGTQGVLPRFFRKLVEFLAVSPESLYPDPDHTTKIGSTEVEDSEGDGSARAKSDKQHPGERAHDGEKKRPKKSK